MLVSQMNRRKVLFSTAALAGAHALQATAHAAKPISRPSVRMGLILKMKHDLELDWRSALKKVAALGFKDVEFPGTLGTSAVECRHVLDDLGLVALGGGAVYKDLNANLEEILKTSQILGKTYVYCYWPWLDGGQNKTVDDWKRLGDTMNQLGARCKAGGLMLAYHNHDMEFLPVGDNGPFPYDILLQHTDPLLMTMQMDLFWVEKSKRSPIPFLNRHPGRISSFHIKERLNTQENGMVCSGESFDNLAVTLKAGLRSGVKHFVIENEDEKDHYDCAQRTLSYVNSLKF
jgi:sugar phosphate isomerase/epimerase